MWLADELRRNHPEVAVVLSTGNAAMIDNTPPRIADLLIKPYKRERFVLAVDRGREWRRQAVEELERQAQLQADVQSRVADIVDEVGRARHAGHDEFDVLWQIAVARIPEVVEHCERVERYTASIARSARRRSVVDRSLRPRRATSRYRQAGDPRIGAHETARR